MLFRKCIGKTIRAIESCITDQKFKTLALFKNSTLKEEDLWSGLWQRRSHFPETVIAIAYEQQGYFEQAQGTYELAMTKARQEYSLSPPSSSIQSEYR